MCMKNKEELRQEFLRRRSEMTKEQVEAGSFCIEQRVLAMEEIRRAEDIFCYISFGKEAMTKGLLEKLHEGGKRVYPRAVAAGGRSPPVPEPGRGRRERHARTLAEREHVFGDVMLNPNRLR